jgi:hypothetical protein
MDRNSLVGVCEFPATKPYVSQDKIRSYMQFLVELLRLFRNQPGPGITQQAIALFRTRGNTARTVVGTTFSLWCVILSGINHVEITCSRYQFIDTSWAIYRCWPGRSVSMWHDTIGLWCTVGVTSASRLNSKFAIFIDWAKKLQEIQIPFFVHL